ncbi:MAG: hypothetical protein KC994_18700 [Candidatus Omnitrophica bacterium]|nr:hypothetical protein [Candidatus Omnitrophota bacterium]
MKARNFTFSGILKLVVLACIAGSANCADIRYMGSGSWTTASNWVGGVLPSSGDTAILNWAGNTVTLGSTAPDVLNVRIGQDEDSNLEVSSGGTLNVLNRLYVGHNNSAGTMTVAAGATINVADILWVGGNGSAAQVTGDLTIDAGAVINVGSHLWFSAGAAGVATVNINGTLNQTGGILGLGTIDAVNPSGGVATVNVNDGGALNLFNIHASGTSIQPGSLLNINGTGQVTLPGDFVGVMRDYSTAGYLAGNGIVGDVDVIYNTGTDQTIVTASTPPGPTPTPVAVVDANTMDSKIVCGYQGWFMAPGDGNIPAIGWRHWGKGSNSIGPGMFGVDMWPDVSEYAEEDLFPVPGVTLLDSSPGKLFSSFRPGVVDVHFRWMEEYGIDGVFLQRFIGEVQDPAFFNIRNRVLEHVRDSANAHGRVFALEYDTSGMSDSNMLQKLTDDWKYLVDTYDITNDPRYLYHDGKPVVEIWGLGFNGRGHTTATAAAIIDFFRNDPTYGGNFLVGGVPSRWRTLTADSESDSGWATIYRSWDMINPWMVGRFSDTTGMNNIKNNVWIPDVAETTSLNIDYMPVVWPGFSWDNLMNLAPGTSLISRQDGQFIWDQLHAVQDVGVNMIFVAMFDEVDESTAIFKVTNNHPVTDNWISYEELPNDWYLRLVGAGTQMLRGEIPLTSTIPIDPNDPPAPTPTPTPGPLSVSNWQLY